MILGDQHIHKYESLNIEFKEFCLNVNEDDFDCLNIEKICKTGILNDNEKKILNNMILNSLQNYFIKYIPRYLSAFINSNIDNAEMYIGVDDYGEITGIPFFGTKHDFEKFIYNIIKLPLYYTKTHDKKNIDYKIVIEELTIDHDLLIDHSDEILKNFYHEKHLATSIRKKYMIERRKWASALNEYTCKLPMLLELKKKEFHQYLLKHAPHLIDYKIYPHEMRNIAHLKVNPNHYIYWLMLFKESEIDKLQSIKPQKPKIPKINQGPNFLLNNLTELRKKFINKNNIKYFVIKIIFPSKANEYDTVYYYNTESKTWLTKERQYNANVGPCCL